MAKIPLALETLMDNITVVEEVMLATKVAYLRGKNTTFVAARCAPK